MAHLTNLDRLEVVIVYCNRLFSYLEGIDEFELESDYKNVDAARYCIHKIAEVLSNIPKGFIVKQNLMSEPDWSLFCLLKDDRIYSDENIWEITFGDDASFKEFHPRFIEVLKELSETEENGADQRDEHPKKTNTPRKKKKKKKLSNMPNNSEILRRQLGFESDDPSEHFNFESEEKYPTETR
ncbi:HepT-like ribonuclease domain-containing protein [Sunxiuqinia rutila]|uniref:HepT-like ribonuclease domain-containing protein n=1 Tax=Sunxiuqinia rutila TaxID=1397841 RepID=UPI003D363D30